MSRADGWYAATSELGIRTLPRHCSQCADCAEGLIRGRYWHVHETACGAANDGTGRLVVHSSVVKCLDELVRLRG